MFEGCDAAVGRVKTACLCAKVKHLVCEYQCDKWEERGPGWMTLRVSVAARQLKHLPTHTHTHSCFSLILRIVNYETGKAGAKARSLWRLEPLRIRWFCVSCDLLSVAFLPVTLSFVFVHRCPFHLSFLSFVHCFHFICSPFLTAALWPLPYPLFLFPSVFAAVPLWFLPCFWCCLFRLSCFLKRKKKVHNCKNVFIRFQLIQFISTR